MPASTKTDSGRMNLRIPPADKALLLRAAALEHTDLTGFVMRASIPAARRVIEKAEQQHLSAEDSLRVLELLDNPPAPNEKLLAAAYRLPKG